LVKQNARLLALDNNSHMVIVDGPPGIGCPVISAAAGADIVLIVTELSSVGIHDMERVQQLARHFWLPTLVCINKADIYPAGSDQILNYCDEHQIEVVGSIPFDEMVTRAIINGEPVTVYQPAAPASKAISQIWLEVISRMHLELKS
jgi:MinD superfamily P-loop ATPase